MANITLRTRIALKVDTAANWANSTLVLLKGEMAFDEYGRYKIGNGSKKWSELSYALDAKTVVNTTDPATSDIKEDGTVWVNSNTGAVWFAVKTATVENTETTTWKKVVNSADLSTTLESYATLASPAFTGTPTAPTAAAGTNTTQIATTAFVTSAVGAEETRADGAYVALTQLGVASTTGADAVTGVATLDTEGKVPSSQLPSYVDDVIEVYPIVDDNVAALSSGWFANSSANATAKTAITPESGKIYVVIDSASTYYRKTYRWGGSAYVLISDSLAIGTTESTAFAGNRGAALESTLWGTGSASSPQDGSLIDRVADLETTTGGNGALASKDTIDSSDLIDDGVVTAAKLAADAVETAKIKDGNVTTAKIADGNVTTAKIADANVTDAKLADNAVVTAKIADSNVTTAKIADSNVTTAKIADGNVTDAKIASMDANKLTQTTNEYLILDCGKCDGWAAS